MNYIELPWMDSPVSVFDICQAHQQLESDYNVNGIVRERPSNARRNASTGVQLGRMKFRNEARWVDICNPDAEGKDSQDDDVRDIYLLNVLKWGLPMDDEMRKFVGAKYVNEWLDEEFPNWRTQ